MLPPPPGSTLFPYTTLFRSLWQSFAVLTGEKSVGMTHGRRTYESALVLRAVTSKDAMTADWARLPYELLDRSEEHTSELQSRENLVCRLLLEKKKTILANKT